MRSFAVLLVSIGVLGVVGPQAARSEVTQQFAIESVPVDGSSPTRLASAPWPLESPVFSPDGRTIAFTYDLASVVLVNADGTGQHALNNIVDAYHSDAVVAPFWSPGGTTVFATAHVWTIPDPRSQTAAVYRFDASTGSVAMVHAGQYASFSRDGRYLAYQTFVDPRIPAGGGVIGVCRPDGSHDTPFGRGSYAAWAPTADRIAYVTRPGYLTVSNATGGARWTLRGKTAGPIAWFPDGKKIAFVHGGPRPGLFVVSRGARTAQRLVDLPTLPGDGPLSVSVSADGRWIAASTDSSTVIVRSNGTHLQVIQAGGAAWAPKRTTLAMISGNTLLLWVPAGGMHVEYTGRQRVAEPAWSPDGTRVLVVDTG